LLLQHGYAEYAQRYVTQYNQLIPHLLHAGISVYAFDLWGHGRSPGTRAVTNVHQAVVDHLAARSRLREQPLPLFVLGHSLGALVTASSLLRDQSGVSGAILMSGSLLYDATPLTLLMTNVAAFFAPTVPVPLEVGDLNLLYRGVEQDEQFLNDPLFYRGKLPMLLGATAGNLAHNHWKLYPKWKVPVLVMHGTADRTTNPEGSKRFFDTVASDEKTLHLVEGGYHELLNDTNRDETLRVLLGWLERHVAEARL
jgi:alpha-beta hydrolase superfamily lysophospholipase